MRILLQMEQYNFSSGKSRTGAAVQFDKNLLFPGRAWVLKPWLANLQWCSKFCSGFRISGFPIHPCRAFAVSPPELWSILKTHLFKNNSNVYELFSYPCMSNA